MGSVLCAFSQTASIMKATLVILAVASLTRAFPVAQEDPNDDVEVLSGGPFDSRAGDQDPDHGFLFPRVRVFLVPVSSRDSKFYGDADYSESRGPPIDSLFSILQSFFGLRQDSETDAEPCLLCDVLDDSLQGVQSHIDSVRDRENEVGLDLPDFTDNDEPDVSNSTHTTQVLDDGSVVHINKTTIADTDENGNSFFFHRAVIHNIGNPDSEAVDTPALEESQEESQGNQDTVVDDGVDAGLLDI